METCCTCCGVFVLHRILQNVRRFDVLPAHHLGRFEYFSQSVLFEKHNLRLCPVCIGLMYLILNK